MSTRPIQPDPFEPFAVTLGVTIRPCRAGDLPALEWFGLFAADRGLIRDLFGRHERGEAAMLVAEANGTASGQVWIDLSRRHVDSTGFLWALRVFPALQRLGIGRRLVAAAERELLARGFGRAEISVERDNPAARRLYEQLGYRLEAGARAMSCTAAPRRGAPAGAANDQWVFRKRLTGPAETAARPEGGRAHG